MCEVIVRFNRSGNRSNDRAERTINLRLMQNRSIAGGEGNSASLRSRSAGSPNGCFVGKMGNRSGNRSVGFWRTIKMPRFCSVFNRSFGPSLYRRTTDHFGLAFFTHGNYND